MHAFNINYFFTCGLFIYGLLVNIWCFCSLQGHSPPPLPPTSQKLQSLEEQVEYKLHALFMSVL